MASAYPDGERRQFQRLKVNIIVVYQVDKPLKVRMLVRKEEIEAKILDLSEGGISISTEYNIPANTLLAIDFMLYKIDKATNFKLYGSLKIKGEVKYNVPEGIKYRLGISFRDLDEENRTAIADFVKVANISHKFK
ncbi:MAG: PilZ domain-containing protein [Candidatus Omnitrophica bacterium]|nr:PilZ domain-containing protein [Candidatus Omnitrophota bacterium]MDD5166754.1 PilZ domain-containing protein [Candidatus Omnitrophota bacterium]